MSMNPEHGQAVSFAVVPYSHYTVGASLCRGKQCCAAIKSQCRHLQKKTHGGMLQKINFCGENHLSNLSKR